MNKKLISKNYTIKNPSGKILIINNLSEFCRSEGLSYSCMMETKNPNRPLKTHKGFSIIIEKNVSKP